MDIKTISAYNRGAQFYAEKFNRIGPRENDIKRAFSYIEKENPKVVELGCGNGRDGAEILKYTDDYLGIDASDQMIELAKKAVPEGRLEIADIETFKFPKNIDIIFSFASLLHTDKESVRKIFNNAYKSLNSKGIFYISLKNAPYHSEIFKDKFGSRLFYFYSKTDIQELTKDLYDVVYTNEYELLDVDWILVVLKKK